MDNNRDIDNNDFYKAKNKNEKIKFLLKYAILAPSTHNTQPWLFRIKDNTCEIYNNKKISLPYADSTGRDLYISFGCLIENLTIVAKYFGVYKNVHFTLNYKSNLIAKFEFKNLENNDSLINDSESYLVNAILRRKTARGIFQEKSIEKKIINQLIACAKNSNISVNYITETDKIRDVAKLTGEGMRIAYRNSNFRKEMANWFRVNLSKSRDGLIGYSLGMPLLMSFIFPIMIRFFNIGSLVSNISYRSIVSSKLICVLSTENNNQIAWIEVGMLAQRMLLLLTSYNINTSIFVAAIEIDNLYKQLQEVISSKDTPQFLFCAGYMDTKQKYSPRHSVDEKLLNS